MNLNKVTTIFKMLQHPSTSIMEVIDGKERNFASSEFANFAIFRKKDADVMKVEEKDLEKLHVFAQLLKITSPSDVVLASEGYYVVPLYAGQTEFKPLRIEAADTLNSLLLNCLFATGQLKEGEMYDVDFDHQFIETEKYDAKPTYKKFLGYRPGVAVIGDLIVGIENSDGNTNVRFHQKDTLNRLFERLEQKGLTVNRFRADCGSCSEKIVEEVEKHCKTFYIRANRCSSLYDNFFALRGWKKEDLGGIEFELASILVEKWKGKAYRLVIQRQKRIDGELDLWEGEYTYRCILTNDHDPSDREIVEFYNLRGWKERILDDMNNGFG